jgi:hypothetical protein
MEKKTKATARPKAAASGTTRRAAKSPVAAKPAAKPRTRATKAAAAPQSETIVRANTPPVDRDQVAKVAYTLFEQSGFQHGRALEHWLEAESRLSRGMKL